MWNEYIFKPDAEWGYFFMQNLHCNLLYIKPIEDKMSKMIFFQVVIYLF